MFGVMTGKAVMAVVGLLLVTGCAAGPSGDSPAGETRFVAGDGEIVLFPAEQRRPAPEVAGERLDGGRLSSAEYAGQILVLNFWASWCAPCRSEAPILRDAAARFEADGVRFVGVNIKDDKTQAQAFERTAKPGYPSVFDQPGRIVLSFQGTVPPAAIPATLIIDRQGRIAARALGAVKHSDLVRALTAVRDES
ncbi:TlpA family protein disulfide reductase [Nonomuraea sp. NPDC049309]|uniref:TlpA family protein disulfide reductase n=1 Tax=Nonomuraea sp. NPDC049309 TaxID=3364350 RepID=UPI0037110674